MTRRVALLALAVLATAQPALALSPGDVTISAVTPWAAVDSNNCAGDAGPHAMFLQARVTNNTAGTLSGLTATLNGFPTSLPTPPSPPTAFTLDLGETAPHYVGSIPPGGAADVYWFVNYPCTLPPTAGSSIAYTITVSDATPNSVTSASLSLTTRSEISANAGGDVSSALIGPGAVVGQILKVTIDYSFGNPASGADLMIQPAGNVSFDAGRFRLVATDITASTFTAGPLTSADNQLYFSTVNGPSQNTLTVDYYFLALATGASSVVNPFADLKSGGQLKYTGNYGICTNTPCDQSLPPPSDPFTLSKSASPTSLPDGGSVTYTVTVSNTSDFDSSVDSFTDTLPAGATYQGFGPASDVTAANSSSVPSVGAIGTIVWRADAGVPPPASNRHYYIPAHSSIELVYVVDLPAAPGTYTNTATIAAGSLVVGPASSNVFVGPTPTPTNTVEPTATDTPEPTATDTPNPPTATNTPTLTNTPEPTATNTPTPTATRTPTATDTPEPTATDTPEPTATDTPSPTATNTAEPTATNTPEPTATDTAEPTATDTPEPTATDTPEPTATNTAEATATDTAEPTATDTPEPTATDTPTPTATDTTAPTATPTPTATDTAGPTNCGDGVLDAGEECDDGALNSDTTPDACRTNCRLAGCGDGVEDTAVADLVFVIETSLSMRGDLKRIPGALGSLPEMAASAGVDLRTALVRFGTGELRDGPDVPDLMLDFTTDGDAFRAALAGLLPRLTGPTESGTEALDFALDTLQLRPRAIPIFVLFTDEDDDLPVLMERGRRREPPSRWLTDARAPLFQARVDAVAERLVAAGARGIFLIKPRNRPSEFQYGTPRLGLVDDQGRFDGPQTLLALTAEQLDHSLQGSLLAAGRCDAGRCAEGSVGYMCSSDSDCGLYARAYNIKSARSRKTRDAFFAALLEELIELAHCQP